jgi:CheY-like chemotaxis protein
MPAKTVLVVDDDPDLLDMLRLVLEDEGYRVWTAENGEQALQTIGERGLPHAILLDLMMPVMDGAEFAQRFRALYDELAPIIVITAYESARRRAAELGAQDWLTKPFDVSSLIEKLRDLLASP